ncbi:MAG: hypothetical protein J5641_02300, partial [Bacteroidales bacterium]|nr:hypothetical protein [Bacteroidales bacterium]
GRLIEAGGDVGSRLMIEAVARDRTEPGLRGCRFFIDNVTNSVTNEKDCLDNAIAMLSADGML